jgi:arginine:pyruvate transaminase
MKFTDAISRLEAAGTDSWGIYRRAQEKRAQGQHIIGMAIGEPDIPTPDAIIESTIQSLQAGRTNYAPSLGDPDLRTALAARYTRTTGRTISPDQIACLPGTQTALYMVMSTIAGPGNDVIVGDPMYATYGPVLAACGATARSVPLRAEAGFRIDADDIAERLTPNTTALLLNSPHNPTGAVLTSGDFDRIGALAREHDLWLVVDEVYEELVFEGATFVSALADPSLADRTIVLNSMSKSHAAPGFRSGWCVAPVGFCERMRPLLEAALFGSPPFIADATAHAVQQPSPVAAGMAKRFAARADRLMTALHQKTDLKVNRPAAGMFALVDASATGMSGYEYAHHLLDHGAVVVMPGSSFGTTIESWVRVALTASDEDFDEGVRRIVAHANALASQ